MTKRVTIAKVGGAAAGGVLNRFRQWQSMQDRSLDPNAVISSEHWTPEIRKQMESYAEQFRNHAADLPMIFFCEYIDPWTCGPIVPFIKMDLENGELSRNSVHLCADRYSLYCYEFPDGGLLAREIKHALGRKHIRKRHAQEDRWAYSILQEAVHAWDTIADRAVIVVLEYLLNASVTDDVLADSLCVVPEWI